MFVLVLVFVFVIVIVIVIVVVVAAMGVDTARKPVSILLCIPYVCIHI